MPGFIERNCKQRSFLKINLRYLLSSSTARFLHTGCFFCALKTPLRLRRRNESPVSSRAAEKDFVMQTARGSLKILPG